MDSAEEKDSESEVKTSEQTRTLGFVLLRWSLVILFPVVSFIVLSFIVGLVAVFLASSSVASPISVPSHCKIVSTSVDLRSSKVCELGLFNYNAKNVFYHFEKSRFRCRYDYYWASIFKVEYKDLSSDNVRLAIAEAPSEALPINCRPNFGEAWSIKDKFKVNETYECWYMYGVPKVSLNYEDLFNCYSSDPSRYEMIKRYYIITTKMMKSWVSAGKWWELGTGIVAGFSTSLVSVTFVMILHQMKFSLPRLYLRRFFRRAFLRVSLVRVCFLFVYVTVMSWLVFQYGKRLGIVQIYRVFNG